MMVDMQEEFVSEAGGPYRVQEAARRVPVMARLLCAFRTARLPVIHRVRRDPPVPRSSFARCVNAEPPRKAGFDDSGLFRTPRFVAQLQPLDSEIVILKPSYGAFYDTPLETILKRLAVDTTVLAGTLTDCCVGTTARQAYGRGFGAVVASDATAAVLPEMHEAELRILRRSFARILPADRILAELGLSPSGPRSSIRDRAAASEAPRNASSRGPS